MLKEFLNTVGVAKNTDGEQHHYSTESNIVKSVFHTLILPLGLSIGSPIAGALYLLFAVTAYFTIFRDKNHYVVAILQFAGALALMATLWFGFILAMGMIGAVL